MATLCINTSHSKFTHLQRQTGLPTDFLTAKIATWVEENNSDAIPSAQELGLEVKYDSEIYPFNEEQEEINYVRTSEEEDNDEESFFFTELEAPVEPVNVDTIPEKSNTLYQIESERKEPTDNEIDRNVTKFLEKIGVDVRSVNKIHDEEGKPLSAIAKADMLNKIIEVVNERAAIDTLPEEASHFFVEMLGPGNDLYKKLYNNITGYQMYTRVVDQYKNLKEYRNEDGSVNFDKLKKEAIGKVIAHHIIKGNKLDESDAKLGFLAKIWKDIMDFIRFHFFGIEQEENPFQTAADKIMNADMADLEEIPGDGVYYSYANPVDGLMQAQKDITLDNSIDNATGQKRHTYYLNGEKARGSVTSYYVDPWLKKIFRGLDERSEEQKLIDITKADYGDVIHDQFKEVIQSHTYPDGTRRSTQLPISPVLSGALYKQINDYVVALMDQYDEGTKFFPELKIFDQKKKIGGSIDLLVVHPTGEVDIYDWKSQEIYRGQDDIKQYKETMYRIQLDEYRKILQKEYGFENFGLVRAIPIRTQFLYDQYGEIQNLRSIEIGNLDLDKIPEEKSYLLPVALKTESTGDKELDSLIEKLNAISEKMSKTRYTKENVYKKKEELNQLRLAIRDLQLRNRIDKLVNLGVIQHKKYSDLLADSKLSGKDIKEGLKILKVFSDSGVMLYSMREQELEVLKESGDVKAIQAFERLNKRFLAMTANVAKLIQNIEEYRDRQVEILADENGIPDALEPEAALGLMAGNFQSLSNIDRSLFRLFSKNLRRAQNQREVRFDKAIDKLKTLKKNFVKWASDKGMSINQALESLLNIDEKGNWNGNFLAKYKKEFYKERDAAIANGTGQWFIDNTDWDPDNKYEEAEKKQLLTFKGIIYDADDKENEKIIKEKMKDWISSHKITLPNGKLNIKALMNKNNQFIKPKDVWLTEKYQELYKKDAAGNYVNKPAVDAYEYFQSLVRYSEEKKMLDKYSPGFIPTMFANNLENFSFGKTSNVFNKNFLEKLQVDSGTQYTPEIDPTDGTIINRVPVYFTKDVGVKREDGTWDYSKKSRDLFKIFGVWAGHMYNYEAMSDMEDVALMILEAEKNKGSLVTDAMGNPVIENNRVKAIDQNDKNAKLLEEFVNYYLYDRQSGVAVDESYTNPFSRKNKDEKTKYSLTKTVQTAINYFGLKTLGLNVISASAQFVGGTGNVIFQALKGQQFTTKTWMQALYLATSSSKARKALQYLNITEGTGKEGMMNDLSLSAPSKVLTRNNAYILQRAADKTVTQPIALGLMLEHMLDENGNIVSIQKYVKNKYNYNETFYNLPSEERSRIKQQMDEEVGKLKEEKSLLSIGVVDEKTGEFSIPGVSKESETYAAFRDKINGVIKKVIGNTGRDDINNIRTGMFGSALAQFRSWIPELVEERLGGLKYDDELDQWTYGKFNTFFGEWVPTRFPKLVKAILTGLGDNAIEMAKEKYQELKAEALENNKRFDITEAEFIDLYVANIRSMLGELVALLALGAGLMWIAGDDDDDKNSGVKKYLGRAFRKYWNEFSFYYNPFEFQKLLTSPVPAVGLLEDFYSFTGAVMKQGAGYALGDEEMMKEAKPAKYFLRSVPVGKEFLLIAAALDDDFRKEWDIKLSNYF